MTPIREFPLIYYTVCFLGQVFARRALGKLDELSKLEKLSGIQSSPETQRAFKEATIKVRMRLGVEKYLCLKEGLAISVLFCNN